MQISESIVIGEVEFTMNEPTWLAPLNRQIQSARGSTKRQLESLREQQLRKLNEPPRDSEKDILREALRILTEPHLKIEENHLIARIKEVLLDEPFDETVWVISHRITNMREAIEQTKADTEDYKSTLEA